MIPYFKSELEEFSSWSFGQKKPTFTWRCLWSFELVASQTNLVITLFLGLDNNQNKRLTYLPPQNIVNCVLELMIKHIQMIKEMPPVDHIALS